MPQSQVEPWLRGTHTDLEPVRRAVVHALELAGEDIRRWCLPLDAEAREMAPLGLPSVAFQVRHIARSIDRLLTYAEGSPLTEQQHEGLRSEHLHSEELEQEFEAALARAIERVRAFAPDQLASVRGVGRALLPTTVAGLLIHVAEHTQRHVGQAITTAKVVVALRESEGSG